MSISGRKIGDGKIHVTLLSRQTQHRRILNEAALVNALEDDDEIIVRKVIYNPTHRSGNCLDLIFSDTPVVVDYAGNGSL